MYCSPTITAEEFKTIHNSLCVLDSVCQHLENIIKPELLNKLITARDNIRLGLSGAYAQDHAASENKYQHYQTAKQKNNFDSIWSMFEVDDLYKPHPYGNVDTLIYKDHWGNDFPNVPIQGPLWIDLYRAADIAITSSGDKHHVYIENFTVNNQDSYKLILSTGS